MDFYKLFQQKNVESKPIYQISQLMNYFTFLSGKTTYSFGIKYSPNDYNRLLSNNDIFYYFMKSNVTQLMMTDMKFSDLIKVLPMLHLRLVDVKFDIDVSNEDDDLQNAIHDGSVEDIYIELTNLIDHFHISIKEFTLRDTNNNMIKIKSNGVIGLDRPLVVNSEKSISSDLIDYLNYGLVTI